MDYRNIYQTLVEILEKEKNPTFSALLKDMSVLSPDGKQVAKSEIMDKLLFLVKGDLEEEDMGYSSSLEFIDSLKEEYPSLNDFFLDKETYISLALEKEAMTAYDFLYWLFKVLDLSYPGDMILKGLVRDFRPVLKNKDGSESLNPFLIDFILGYKRKPTLKHNGYSYAASWLFGINAVTQTILTRIGLTLWNSLYHHFELYSPRAEVTNNLASDLLMTQLNFENSKKIKEYLPLFVYLGRKISFISEGKEYSICFPFADMDMEDITLEENGKKRTFDFLDDLFNKEIDGNKKLSDIFDEAKDIKITAE